MKVLIELDTERPLSDNDRSVLKMLFAKLSNVQSVPEKPTPPPEAPPIVEHEKWSPPAAEEPAEKPVLKRRGKYMDKICADCKKVFTPASGRAERCPECTVEHKRLMIKGQRARQTARRRAAKQGIISAPEPKVKKEPEKPKTVACRNCHKPYVPAADDRNFYCPKCVEKLRSRPAIQPLRKTSLTVEEVLKLPVVDRYKYAYMWSYAERQKALALKPVYPKPTGEEAEFWKRCATGDFMDD